MKKLFPIGILLLSSASVVAQNTTATTYANLITQQSLKNHLTIIASDDFEGRETGTEGQRKAAAYIEQQFSLIGLKKPASLKTYQQLYPLVKDSLVKSLLIINGKTPVAAVDYVAPLATNENGKFKSNTVVFAGYGINDAAYNDYANINVKGKIVVFVLGEPKKDGKYFLNADAKLSEWSFPGITKKLAVAKAKGAVGALVINPNMAEFSKRMVDNNTASAVTFTSIPEPKGAASVQYVLLAHKYANTILPFSVDSVISIAKDKGMYTIKPNNYKIPVNFEFSKRQIIINASNVVGIIEGTDKKDEFVFLTGHYDHLGKRDGKIYYGADDDGSGTCAVIQMATAFAKAAANGIKPRRTLVFMTVSGEEKGLWGSEYYSDHPLYPLHKTSVDLNTDMVGRTDTERKTDDTLNYVYVVGHDKISSELPIINEAANTANTKLVLDYKFDDPKDPNRIYFRSDHYNFARKGVPVLFFYDGMLKSDYHKPTDTVDKINFELYQKRVQMIFYTAWDIANRDNMLVRDKPLPTATR